MNTIPFIWSNDDITVGLTDKLLRQTAFIERFGLRGVFFVIPRSDGRGIDQDAALLREIDKARQRGHEFYQHGYEHTAFESGVPETWMLDFAPAVRRQFDVQRLELEKQHTLDAMVRTIEAGRAIWRRAFHEDSPGYRPGWGAFCTNLYRALDALGFQWISAGIPCTTSWLWNNGQWDAPMEFREGVPANPHTVGRLIEYTLGGDYAFSVPNEPARIDAMVGLAMQELDYYHTHGWPMVICSHWHGLERNGDSGYAVHEDLLPSLLASGKIEPMTMTHLTAWVQAEPGRLASPLSSNA